MYLFLAYSCPDFPPLTPPPRNPCSLRQPPTLVCVHGSPISSLATLFPILYFISPRLFCNYLFVLPNPLNYSPNFPHSPPIYLSLTFGIVIMMCRGVGLPVFILLGTPCASWTCVSVYFTKSGHFSFINFSNRFPVSCSFSSPNAKKVHLTTKGE